MDRILFRSELDRIKSGDINKDTQVYYVLYTGMVAIVKEGEKGYHPTNWDWSNIPLKEAQKLADKKNEEMGISKETAEAIVTFSMFPV